MSHGSVFIVSFGPVPTPKHQTVEGGGLRAWGLAQGLRDRGYAVTVGVNAAFPLDVDEHDGIQLVNWTLDDAFAIQINSFDAVIASYCMGDPSVFIAARIQPDVRLILDLYVPIYVEVAARDSDDLETEYRHYMADIERFNMVLGRGDYFLCANDNQMLFYTGILGSLGVLNPQTYRDHRLVVVPFGVERRTPTPARNPYRELGLGDDDFVLLWFGGLYPWFKIDSLLEAVARVASTDSLKLVIVGGKNPFNTNPDFVRQYDDAVAWAKTNGLIDASVFFVDWIDYDTRADWYTHADVVISLNTPGNENALSWRTRVIDFVWGEVVMATTGGDPLSDLLLSSNAAIGLPGVAADDLVEGLQTLIALKRSGGIAPVLADLVALKQGFYWDVVVEPILPMLASNAQPYERERERRGDLAPSAIVVGTASTNKLFVLVRKARTAVRIARTKGIGRSFGVAMDVLRNQFSHRVTDKVRDPGRRFVFVSHPIDHTGAPLVLLDVVEEFAAKFGGKSVHVVFPSAEPDLRKRLSRDGVRTTKSVDGMGDRFLSTQLSIAYDDFVLLNTLAIYDNYREYIFDLLDDGKLAHAYWFIHEDIEQLSLVGQAVATPRVKARITKLANAGKLTVLAPSDKVATDFGELFETTNTRTVPLRVTVDPALCRPRPPEDYDRIDMLLSGNPLDGRKGHFLALAALGEFEARYRSTNPEQYRDYSLTLVAVGDDYVARQVKAIGASVLGNRFVSMPSVPRADALLVTRRCNANICCSLNEAFALYVAEGMLMGHVLLRNDSAGCAEQLRDGENGYLITDDVLQFAAQIEKLLNKSATNESLAEMGKLSQKIANEFTTNSYVDGILGSSTS